VRKKPVGHYSYMKDGKHPLTVAVHLLRLDREAADFRERDQRRSAWLPPDKAADRKANQEGGILNP